jgi:hypothetical protein
MSKRSRRGGRGVADLYAARQREDVVIADGDEPEDDIEVIEADGDEQQEDATPVVVEADGDDEGEADDDEADPAAALTTMQRQLAALQNENATLKQQANHAEVDVAVSQHVVIKQALAASKAAIDAAESDIERAMAAGDHKGVAKATRELAKAQQDADRFELASDELETEIADRKKRPAPRQQPTPSADPYSESVKKFSKPSQDWLMKHRQHIEGNEKMGLKAQALAQLAIADGIDVDTPEFFQYLDKGMGFVSTTKEPRRKPAPAQAQRGAPSGPRAGSVKRNEVTLTRAERETAAQLGMKVSDYARYKLEIERNGKDPSRSGPVFSAQSHHSSRR